MSSCRSQTREKAPPESIGSKSLNQCKKADVKFSDLFLLTEWLEGNFTMFPWFYRWTFQYFWIFVEITAYFFIFQLILWCDVVKFLNHKPDEWMSFAWYHIVGIRKLWFSRKLFDLSSTGLEITVVRKFSWILKREEKQCNSENIEDFRIIQRQIYCIVV